MITEIKRIKDRKPFEIEAKRFYIPFVVKAKCPECGFVVEVNLNRNSYMSFPSVGQPESLHFSHCLDEGECDLHEWDEWVILKVDLVQVANAMMMPAPTALEIEQAKAAEFMALSVRLADLVEHRRFPRGVSMECASSNGPGHCHGKAGIWDSDNGELAGKPCLWCWEWQQILATVASARKP